MQHAQNDPFDVIVVGADVSGLAAARVLQEQGRPALTGPDDPSEADVHRHCPEIYGIDTDHWRLVACGDQFGNASTDGAIASGQQAAQRAATLLD